MSDKKYSAREAAIMVLDKARELYKTTLAKSDHQPHPGAKSLVPAYGAAVQAEQEAHLKSPKGDSERKERNAKMLGKSDQMGANPDAKADADLGEKVEQDVQEHEENNADPAHEAPMKGHIKLAKFMGRMEHKKGQKSMEMDKAETGHEMGINRQSVSNTQPGVSEAGGRLRTANKYGSDMQSSKEHAMGDTKDIHKEKLNQIHQMSKPKLP